MRDYLSPAKRYVSRVMAHPGSLGDFVVKRKSLSFAIAASFVVITTIGFVTVRGIMQGSKVYQDSVSKSDDSSIHTTVTTDNLPEPSTPAAEPTQASSSSNSSDATNETTKPTVTVNDQKIEVPANGSVSRTIQSNNGTTKVDISVNSSSTTSSSSNSSTNLTVNTNSSSRTVTRSQ